MFGSVSISGVPSECYGKDLIINAYDSSSNNPLALFGVSSTDIVVLDNTGVFVISSSGTGLSIVTNSTSSFTVSFTVPVSSVTTVQKLTVPGANASGNDAFKVNSVYWSSTEYVSNTNKAFTRYLVQASSEGQDLKNNTLGSSTSGQYDNVLPIREF